MATVSSGIAIFEADQTRFAQRSGGRAAKPNDVNADPSVCKATEISTSGTVKSKIVQSIRSWISTSQSIEELSVAVLIQEVEPII